MKEVLVLTRGIGTGLAKVNMENNVRIYKIEHMARNTQRTV